MPVATRLLTSDAGFLERILHAVAPAPVGSIGVGRRARAPPGPLPERLRPRERSRCRRRAPRRRSSAMAVHADPAVEERLDRDLVGPAEHRRCPAAGPAGLVRQTQARERVEVGGLEGELRRPWSSRWRRTARRAGRARRARARSGGACRASRAGRWWRRRRTRPCRARSTAGARRRRSGRRSTPNSSWASITSRPLFISVDESMVILAPMSQVGCSSASATVTVARARARVRPRNGPPLAVRTARCTSSARPARRPGTARSARCRPGRSRRRPGSRRRGDDRPAGDEALLVGQREPLAVLERGEGGGQPGEADDGVEHDVDLGQGRPVRSAPPGYRHRAAPTRAERRTPRPAPAAARRCAPAASATTS